MLTAADIEKRARARVNVDVNNPGVDPSPCSREFVLGCVELHYNNLLRWQHQKIDRARATTEATKVIALPGTYDIVAEFARFDSVFRVTRRLSDGRYIPIACADELAPEETNEMTWTWRETSAGLIQFGPPQDLVATYKIQFFQTETIDPLGAGAETIRLASGLELSLIYDVAGEIHNRMHGEFGEYPDRAKAIRDEQEPLLKARQGAHPRRTGLIRRAGY